MPRSAILVQARMSSQRCPQKIMADLNGAPLIQRLVEALAQNQHQLPVIICTSTESSDDPVEHLCQKQDFYCFRGPLNDVAQRFLQTCNKFQLEHVVRISGDSPWFNVKLVDQVVEAYENSKPDIYCNIHPRTFPKGQSLEMFSSQLLQNFYPKMNESDREHVTPIFYRHADQLKIENLEFHTPSNHLDLSIDTPEQLLECQNHFKTLNKAHWKYDIDEILDIYTGR
jgi:spore coat polysaccharide biosynthesis protein SpsF